MRSSWEEPWFAISDDGVEDDEELSDAGGEGLLAGFPGGPKLLIIGGNDGVGSACDQCGHVEGGCHRRSAAGDGLAAAPDAAVAIDGRHADERFDFAPIEAPEFGQFGDERSQSGFAHSRHTDQKVGVGLPDGAFADRGVDVAIKLGQFGLQEVEMPVDGLEDARLACETTAVFLRHDHLNDLPPARHQFAQRPSFGVGDELGGRANGLGEVSDRGGVEAVGLGELAGCAGEIADLTGIDHRQGQMGRSQRAGDHGFVSARRLERDQDRRESAQALHKARQTFVVTRDGEGLSAWPDADVQPILEH